MRDCLLLPARFLFGLVFEKDKDIYNQFIDNLDYIFDFINDDKEKKELLRNLNILRNILQNIDNEIIRNVYLEKLNTNSTKVNFFEYKLYLERILNIKIDSEVSIIEFLELEKAAKNIINEQKGT